MQKEAVVTEYNNLPSSGLLALQTSRIASTVHSAGKRYVHINWSLKVFRPLLQGV